MFDVCVNGVNVTSSTPPGQGIVCQDGTSPVTHQLAGQDLPIEIHTVGPIVLSASHPLTGGIGGTAEILPDGPRPTATQCPVSLVYEIHLRLDTLHRLFVQHMKIRGLGLGFSGA